MTPRVRASRALAALRYRPTPEHPRRAGRRTSSAATALFCLPLLASSAAAGPADGVALPAAPARPALALSATGSNAPVVSEPAVPSLGSALQAQALTPAPTPDPTPETAARIAPSNLLASGIPGEALTAYVRAATLLSHRSPGCHLSWPVLAGIGRVESDHGRYAGSVLSVGGVAVPPIIGPRLDGTDGFAAVADTDGGRLDGDTDVDRAVGPMQFIPSSWARVAIDADGDGKADPQDIDDAAAAAAIYLCASGRDLATGTGLGAALFSYNHSADYVTLVAGVARSYAAGAQ